MKMKSATTLLKEFAAQPRCGWMRSFLVKTSKRSCTVLLFAPPHVAQWWECHLCDWTHPLMTSEDDKQSHGNLCRDLDLDLDLWASQVCPEHPVGHAGGCFREQDVLRSVARSFPHRPLVLVCEDNRTSVMSLHVLVLQGLQGGVTRTLASLRALTPWTMNSQICSSWFGSPSKSFHPSGHKDFQPTGYSRVLQPVCDMSNSL